MPKILYIKIKFQMANILNFVLIKNNAIFRNLHLIFNLTNTNRQTINGLPALSLVFCLYHVSDITLILFYKSHFQSLTSGRSIPYSWMYCLCSTSLSFICWIRYAPVFPSCGRTEIAFLTRLKRSISF